MSGHLCYLSIGSNIDRESNILTCLDLLDEQFGLCLISSVYESEPIGFDGDPFFNLAISITTDLELRPCADTLRGIEHRCGRRRDEIKFSGRTLDIDIILFDQLQGLHDGIQLPRAELFENAYVLWPLAEIAPDLLIPGSQCSAAALWNAYDKHKQSLQRIAFNWKSSALPVALN